MFGIWLVACVYTVGVCYRFGYGRDVATLTYVLGFPDWIFWGVVVPWTVCTVLCFVIAYFVMRTRIWARSRRRKLACADGG